jgi:NADH-quinone oxidoreductase subunit G
MLAGGVKAAILLNTEPEFDSAAAHSAVHALGQCQIVVSLNPFKANMAFADVILPVAPFTETPGTFINAEGRVQSFHAVVKPLGETRPGWKVRVRF